MTRVRTKKTSKYFTISNSTAQDKSLTFQALGLLSYCLSMPEEWDFHPQVIWKERNCGRDSCYNMFNELIRSYHCIRIRKPNPKAKNLPGEIEYEIFDEIDDCKDRILELEKTEKFVEHGGNFNKCFRHSVSQDTEAQYTESRYTENQYLLKETEENKETDIQKKQQQQAAPVAAAVFKNQGIDYTSPSGKTKHIDESEIFKHFLSLPYKTQTIQQAILIIREKKEPIGNILKLLETICIGIENNSKPVVKSKVDPSKLPHNVPFNTAPLGCHWDELQKKYEEERKNK